LEAPGDEHGKHADPHGDFERSVEDKTVFRGLLRRGHKTVLFAGSFCSGPFRHCWRQSGGILLEKLAFKVARQGLVILRPGAASLARSATRSRRSDHPPAQRNRVCRCNVFSGCKSVVAHPPSMPGVQNLKREIQHDLCWDSLELTIAL